MFFEREEKVEMTTEERSRLEEAASHGDVAAAKRLLVVWLPLVKKIAGELRSSKLDFADRYQAGCIGLLVAIRTFNPEFGVKFYTYARKTIKNEILNEIRKQRIGSGFGFGSLQKVQAIINKHHSAGDVQPSNEEIASEAGMSVSTTNVALSALAAERGFLDEGDHEDADGQFPWGRRVAQTDLLPDIRLRLADELRELEDVKRNVLEVLDSGLSPVQSQVIRLRYGLDDDSEPMNGRQIGKLLGVSWQRVEQIEKIGLRLLAKELDLADLDSPPTEEEDRELCRRNGLKKTKHRPKLADLRLEDAFPAVRAKLAELQDISNLRQALDADFSRPIAHA